MILGLTILVMTLFTATLQAEELPCSSELQDKLSKVTKDLRERRLPQARALLESLQPQFSEPQCKEIQTDYDLRLSRLLLEEGRLTELAEHFSKLVPPEGTGRHVRYLNIAGGLAYQLGQYAKAREHYEHLLKIDLSQGNAQYIAEDYYLIANTYAHEADDIRDRTQVHKAYSKALAFADPKDNIVTPLIHMAIGRLTDGDKGTAWLSNVLERKDLQSSVRVGTLKSLALRFLETDPQKALEYIAEAEQIAEKAWMDDENPWPKMELTNDRITVRWATLDRADALADADDALAFIEAMRAVQSKVDQRAGLFSVWTEAYHRLVGQILESRSKPTQEDLALAFRYMERYRARALADSVKNPEEAFAELDEVILQLGADEALLAFQLAPTQDVYGRFAGGSWLLVAYHGGCKVFRLPERADLIDRIIVYLDLLKSGDPLEEKIGARLYQDLLAEGLTELPEKIDKLLLIPDDDLHLLPFSALQEKPEALPLGLRFQLTNLPSASLWVRWRQTASRDQSTAALVLANPTPEGSPALTRLDLGELPHAEQEGRVVIEQVGRDSVLRLGEQATEAYFKTADLERFGILHFAAHAVVDNIDPRRSAVHLAAGEGEDGALHGDEIAQLDLDQRIVLLSTCHSATGRVLRGEGAMSLARSFFEAGATTVIGSLWPLDDHQTQLLFEAFYRHLANGDSVRAALQQAQTTLQRQGAPAGAWAGLVVLGAGARQPLPSRAWPSTFFSIAFFTIIVCSCLAFLYLFSRWRSYKRREASSS